MYVRQLFYSSSSPSPYFSLQTPFPFSFSFLFLVHVYDIRFIFIETIWFLYMEYINSIYFSFLYPILLILSLLDCFPFARDFSLVFFYLFFIMLFVCTLPYSNQRCHMMFKFDFTKYYIFQMHPFFYKHLKFILFSADKYSIYIIRYCIFFIHLSDGGVSATSST